MRITVLGGCGAWPSAGSACSGFLVEHEGFRVVVDLGYAVLPRLLEHTAADGVDAVLISHGHPDHCADLNPLLRARALDDDPPPALPVFAPPRALDAVLALDRPGMLDSSYLPHEFTPGAVRARSVRGGHVVTSALGAQRGHPPDGRRAAAGLHR